MLLGDTLAIALSVIGFLLSLQGLWLVCRAMFPRRVERAAEKSRRNALACFFLGLPITGFVALIGAVLARRGGMPGQLTAWVIVSLFIMYAGTGLSGFVTFLGERLASPADAQRPWKSTIRGGVALQLAYLLPVIGWFVLLPASLILGVGATTLSFFGSARQDLRATLAGNRMHAMEPPPGELPALNSVEAGV
ncbi:MAG TPA: hypothetical protein VLJ39_12680 [Tepidisphaeraceae bacterium]|jgi:hypothetical protein|nr:hypothetical protein [Tepidisphaeraceae bacterium]